MSVFAAVLRILGVLCLAIYATLFVFVVVSAIAHAWREMSLEDRLYMWLWRRREARRLAALKAHAFVPRIIYVGPHDVRTVLDECSFVWSDDGSWGEHHCGMPRAWHEARP